MKRVSAFLVITGIVLSSFTTVNADHPRTQITKYGTEMKAPCYYYQPRNPDESPKFFSCSYGEVQMLGIKMIMRSIQNTINDYSTIKEMVGWLTDDQEKVMAKLVSDWWEWRYIAIQIADSGTSDVSVDIPLSHYHVKDYMKIGDNVTAYTVPSGTSDYILKFDDKYRHGRPIKVAGKWTTNTANCHFNGGVKLVRAAVLGGLLQSAGNIYTTKVAPELSASNIEQVLKWAPAAGVVAEITIDESVDSVLDATPDCGETETLYDILHLVYDERGRVNEAQVYRVNIHVTADGNIRVARNGEIVDGEKVNGFFRLPNAQRDWTTREWVW